MGVDRGTGVRNWDVMVLREWERWCRDEEGVLGRGGEGVEGRI